MVHEGPAAELDHEPHVDLTILREDDPGRTGPQVSLVAARGEDGVAVARGSQSIRLTLAEAEPGSGVSGEPRPPSTVTSRTGTRTQAGAEDDGHGASARGRRPDPDLGVPKILEEPRDPPHVGSEEALFEGKLGRVSRTWRPLPRLRCGRWPRWRPALDP